MPSSQFSQISTIMNAVARIAPQSVLDVGCGYGKYGMLCREYIELWLQKEPRIDAIDVFRPYIKQLQRAIYDDIYMGEAIKQLKKMDSKSYDLVLAIDILEHFTKEDGLEFIKELRRVGKHVLISTPKRVKEQGDIFGNEYETHRSQWNSLMIDNTNQSTVIYEPNNWIVVTK